MKKPSRLDYAYAVGRVRALERYLVERAVFAEAAEEQDINSSLKIVFDAGKFSREMSAVRNSGELDEFLEEQEKHLLSELEELFLEGEILEALVAASRPERAAGKAGRIEYSFIDDYLRHAIDLANLKILIRLKYLKEPREKFARLLLKGGYLDEKTLLGNYEETLAVVGEKIQATPYRDVWNKAVDTLEARETFIDLERGIEDFLIAYLRRAKYIVFGPEPVFAYGLAKKHELRLMRILGVGKLTGIPVELLKRRISETYV